MVSLSSNTIISFIYIRILPRELKRMSWLTSRNLILNLNDCSTVSNYGCRFSCSSLEVNQQMAEGVMLYLLFLKKLRAGSYCANRSGGESAYERVEMPIVSLRGVNFGFGLT